MKRSLLVIAVACVCLLGPVRAVPAADSETSRKTLAGLAQRAGLRVEKLHYVNAVGFFGWWINAQVFRREAQSERQIRIFDRCVVPWLSRLEAIAPPGFGQSLFAVLRKP